MKLSLVVMTPGAQEGKALEIKLAQFVIGRDPQCQLRPASPVISKRHCALIQRDSKVFIRDFDSTNGTFVNDRQIKGEVEVKNGDVLKAGPLLFRVQVDTPAPKPAEKPAAKVQPAVKAAAMKKPAEDEDIANMLLSLGDDDAPGGPSLSGDSVPDGSTVMELEVPPARCPMPRPAPTPPSPRRSRRAPATRPTPPSRSSRK